MANRITLNRADADNAGRFVDAGETLTIGEDAIEGQIGADRAQALLDMEGAIDAAAPAPAAPAATPPADHDDA